MTEIEITKQINAVKAKSWESLFVLTQNIEQNLDDELINKFFKLTHDLKIVLDFDWMHWEEGKELLDNRRDFSDLSLTTICKLITAIVRNERFCDGFYIQTLVMEKWVQ